MLDGRFYDESMSVWDAVALVGEMLSWIGLGVGVPVLLLGALVRFVEGPWRRVEITVAERDGVSIARWFAGEDFRERPLRRDESAYAGTDSSVGVVSANNPARVRLGEPPHLQRVLLTLGVVFVAVGTLGLIASWLPVFF
jgi:hypothetical protein